MSNVTNRQAIRVGGGFMEADKHGVRAGFFQCWDAVSVALEPLTRSAFLESTAVSRSAAAHYLPVALVPMLPPQN